MRICICTRSTPGHFLGHRVLDLQARIGLHEYEGQGTAFVDIDQEFESAQALVADAPRHRQRGLDEAPPQRGAEGRAGCHLDQLLEAALQRAFALPERHHVVPVAHHLHLDVPRPGHQALDVHRTDPEGRQGLGDAARMRLRQLADLQHRPHAASAAAVQRLQHHRRAALCAHERLGLGQGDGAARPRHQGDFAVGRQFACLGLVPEQPELLHGRPDEAQSGICTGLREIGALAQVAITRVHCIASVRARRFDQGGDVQVRGRSARLQRDSVVTDARVHGARIVLRP